MTANDSNVVLIVITFVVITNTIKHKKKKHDF